VVINKNIVLRGKIFDFSTPVVMAIINITPDSFYSKKGFETKAGLLKRVEKAVNDGAKIIDIGGCSTRPNAEFVDEEEEIKRVVKALKIIRKNFPDVIISVDTFRANIAEMAVNQYQVDIINDISGGAIDKNMLPTIAKLNIPYILMHTRGTPQNMQQLTDYKDLIPDILKYFAEKIETLRYSGLTSDIILDLGYGFAKTIEQNYELLTNQKIFECFGLPILTGISRKSMINRVLGTTPEQALNGTSVLNTIALMNGANILRVHDVKEAVQTIKLVLNC